MTPAPCPPPVLPLPAAAAGSVQLCGPLLPCRPATAWSPHLQPGSGASAGLTPGWGAGPLCQPGACHHCRRGAMGPHVPALRHRPFGCSWHSLLGDEWHRVSARLAAAAAAPAPAAACTWRGQQLQSGVCLTGPLALLPACLPACLPFLVMPQAGATHPCGTVPDSRLQPSAAPWPRLWAAVPDRRSWGAAGRPVCHKRGPPAAAWH